MRQVRVIRDPVHGYLTVAAHETIIIDHPVTQRLRRINQTGLAELVFPEARTSRLVHSFGAMHLASLFLTSALENTDEQVALSFFEEIDRLGIIDRFAVNDKDVDTFLHVATYAGSGLLAGRVVFRSPKLRKLHYQYLLAILEAALRLAALFHDLGHLPFSHDFEFALKDFITTELRVRSVQLKGKEAETVKDQDPLQKLRSGLPPHETIGHQLANIVLTTLVEAANPTPVERAAFKLAVKILDHEERYDEVPAPQVSALGWLHSLVDGEIDVDRADYLLRDARALGLEFANYDLERLLANVKLACDPQLGYITVIREQGLTAVESFLLSRSRSHQVLVRHPKCAQIGAALRYATTATLKNSHGSEFLGALRSLISSSDTTSENLQRFARVDDSWWIQTLQNSKVDGDPVLNACLRLVLWREPTLQTVWKRKGDLSQEQRVRVKRITDQELDLFEVNKKRLFEERQALIAIHKFRPYAIQARESGSKSEPRDAKLCSVILIQTQSGELQPAAQISPLIASLYSSWEDDIHMQAFVPKNSATSADEILSYFKPSA